MTGPIQRACWGTVSNQFAYKPVRHKNTVSLALTTPACALSSYMAVHPRTPCRQKQNCCVTKASSETSDSQEALAELRAGGFKLWSTMPTPAHGRSETYLADPDGRGSR